MAHISGQEGPEYRGLQVRACICSMAGGRVAVAGGGRVTKRCVQGPPRGFRMPFDCGIWLQPRDEAGWWRMHLVLRFAFFVHPGVVHRRPPPW